MITSDNANAKCTQVHFVIHNPSTQTDVSDEEIHRCLS